MDGSIPIATALTIAGAVLTPLLTAIVYQYKTHNAQSLQTIERIEKQCTQTINNITTDRDFWRSLSITRDTQITLRDQVLQKTASTLSTSPP
jgi:hypothetical protein